MARIIEFVGHSDDTFGWQEHDARQRLLRGDDHDDCANGKVRAYRVESEGTGTAVIVTGVYGKAPAGVWSVGIAPDDEGIAIPEWATRPYFRTDGYSPVLALTVPDDTTITLVAVDGDAPEKEED
jgi:hypothetical protein